MPDLVPKEVIASKIVMLRHKKVMLDRDLAELYGVPTGTFNQAVKRNKDRFPNDFMFQLTRQEVMNLKSQFVISSWGGIRKMPYAFTEQGVAMLSSVLNSKRAVQVNIQIMRIFTKLRELVLSHKDLRRKIEALERKDKQHDKQIESVFEVLKQLLTPPEKPKRQIGFRSGK